MHTMTKKLNTYVVTENVQADALQFTFDLPQLQTLPGIYLSNFDVQ